LAIFIELEMDWKKQVEDRIERKSKRKGGWWNLNLSEDIFFGFVIALFFDGAQEVGIGFANSSF
jgi:hypothetical protein